MARILALFSVAVIGLGAALAAQVEKPATKPTAMRQMPPGKLTSYPAVRLLMAPGVLDELKVTDEQRAHFKKTDAEFDRQSTALSQTIQREISRSNGLPDRTNSDAQQQFVEARRSLVKQLEESWLKTLSKRQSQRLKQIQLQADGPLTFLRPEIQEKLNMSPEQIQEIEELVRQANQDLVEARNTANAVASSVTQADPKNPNRRLIAAADAPTYKAAVAKAVKDRDSIRQALDSSIAKVSPKETAR